MRYLSFKIQRYRAITEPLVVDISRKSLLPIIGINECGKTTVLNAIFAFDENNDTWSKGKHLENIHNLYSTERDSPIIEATIEIDSDDLLDILKTFEKDDAILSTDKKGIRAVSQFARKLDEPLVIERDLDNKKYNLKNEFLSKNTVLAEYVASEVVDQSPYILYFDDFTESVEEEIEIKKTEDDLMEPWLSILEQLFKRTDSSYSLFDLKEMEDLQRKSVISDVTKYLNTTLAAEWSRFSLEEKSVLEVAIDYRNGEAEHLLLQIKETISGGRERFFGIKNRSKGFFWFFNFVMKLEFNPKVRDPSDKDTIYLLDEPGSYLHANAQSKLCEKLSSLSENNVVVYCTHSHYLLNPDIVPINSVQVVERDQEGGISMNSVAGTATNIKGKGAFQPLLDALEVRPLVFDLICDNTVLVEGIYDYYVFELFKDTIQGAKSMKFFPCINAHSILYNISFMIFGGVKYVALWDNDDEGRKMYKKAGEHFGEMEAKKFLLLPPSKKKARYRLEDLFDSKDVNNMKKDLQIPANASFEKTILSLYFAPTIQKKRLMKNMSEVTKKRVKLVFEEVMAAMKVQ